MARTSTAKMNDFELPSGRAPYQSLTVRVTYGALSDHGAKYIAFKVDVCVTALCSSSKMRPQLPVLFLIAFLSFLLCTGASQAAQDAGHVPRMQ